MNTIVMVSTMVEKAPNPQQFFKDCLECVMLSATNAIVYVTSHTVSGFTHTWDLLFRPERVLANKIFEIIESCGTKKDGSGPYAARDTFRLLVLKFIKVGVPIRMVLPAFPFKSRNRGGKVLGRLPDLGEDISLARLQMLCDDITHIYPHGAELTIVSDGIVYNDVLMISDEDTWAYSQMLREIGKRYPSLKFKRMADLLGHSTTNDRTVYLASAPVQRKEFVARFTPDGYDVEKSIKNDEDVKLTYLGYVKWLEKEMENVSDLKLDENGHFISNQALRRKIKALARKMITRGSAFTNIIKATRGDFVRLSIHQSVGINKFPIQLIPQAPGEVCRTPWHSAIAVSWDGSIKPGHAEDFPSESYELVYKDGRPYCLQEKSESQKGESRDESKPHREESSPLEPPSPPARIFLRSSL